MVSDKNMSKNKSTKTIEDLKMEMITHDYKTGQSWKYSFIKKKLYKNFERAIFFHYLDLIQEIRDAAEEDED